MPGLLRRTGLALAGAHAHVYAEIGHAELFPPVRDAYAPLVARAEILPVAQVERWVAEQREAQELGTFLAACNDYACLAAKEPAPPSR